jgi:hypothetical protein
MKQTTKSLIDKYTKEIMSVDSEMAYYTHPYSLTDARYKLIKSKLKQLLKEYDAKKKYA